MIKEIENTYRENYDRNYHSTVRLINGKYVVNPNFIKGSSLGSFFYANPIQSADEIIIDISSMKGRNKEEWLTIELENGADENSGIHADKESAEEFLFHNYESVIEIFSHDMQEANNIDEETALTLHSNVPRDWRDFEKFKERIYSTEYPIVYLYQNLPNMDPTRSDFQLIHINLP